MKYLHTFVPLDLRLYSDPIVLNMIAQEPAKSNPFALLIDLFAYLMECNNLVGNYKINHCLRRRIRTTMPVIRRMIEKYDLFVYNPHTGEFYSHYLRQANNLPADIASTNGFVFPEKELFQSDNNRATPYGSCAEKVRNNCAESAQKVRRISSQLSDNQDPSFKIEDNREKININTRTTTTTEQPSRDAHDKHQSAESAAAADHSHYVNLVFKDKAYMNKLMRRFQLREYQLPYLQEWFIDRCECTGKEMEHAANVKQYLTRLLPEGRNTRKEFEGYCKLEEAKKRFQEQLDEATQHPKQETREEFLLRTYHYLSDFEIIHEGKRYDYLGDPIPDDAKPQWNCNFRWSYIHKDWIKKAYWYEKEEQKEGRRQGFSFDVNVIPENRHRIALAYQRQGERQG